MNPYFVCEETPKEVVIKAVRRSPYALMHVSEQMKDDKDIVLEAVKVVGCVLRHASERLRDDKDVVIAAVRKAYYAIEFASERLREDKYIQWLSMLPGLRKKGARERLIKGVMEEQRVRRKYHPEGPFLKAFVENDMDLN
jgi:hypothetical protein